MGSIDSMEGLVQMMRVSLETESHEERMEATRMLREYMSEPASFVGFVSVISEEQAAGVRQQAAVFLLQTMSHWTNLDEETKEGCKRMLLEGVYQEEERLVRLSVGVAVAVIARRELVRGSWDVFLPTVHAGAQSDNVQAREVSFAILKRMVRFFGTNDPSFFSELVGLWMDGLTDTGSASVRVDAFAALAVMTAYFEDESDFENFAQIFPAMLGAFEAVVEARDEDKVASMLGILEDMLDISPTLVPLLWADLVRFSAELTRCGLEDVRKRAIASLCKYVKMKPLLLLKHDLVDLVLNVAFEGVVEEETDVDEGNSIPSNAQSLIDDVCLNVGPSHTTELCMSAAARCLSQNGNPHVTRGGLMILAMAAEGCQGMMRDQLDELVTAVQPHLESSDELVRDGCMMVLYQFAEHLKPDIHNYHAFVIASALDGMNEELVSARMSAVRALMGMISFLDRDVVIGYLEHIMEGYVNAIVGDDPCPPLMCAAVTGIGVLAISVGEAFAQYFEPTMELLEQITAMDHDDALNVRSRAIETIGGVAQACGMEAFAPYASRVMANAFEGLKLEYCTLREHTYSFFGRLATLMKGEFAAYVDDVFPILQAVCTAPDMAVFAGDLFVDDEYEVQDDDYEVPLDAQEEKGSAVCTIGVIATALGPAFMPYVKDACTALEGLLQYDNEDVRAAVVTALGEVATVVGEAAGMEKPCYGLPPNPAPPAAVAEIAEYVIPKLLIRMYSDESVQVVSRATGALGSLTRVMGSALFVDDANYELMSKIALLMFQRELECQRPVDESYSDDEEDALDAAMAGDAMVGHAGHKLDKLDVEAPIDLSVLETDVLCDALESVAEALGPAFAPCYDEILESLVHKCQPARPVYDRCAALGMLAAGAVALGVDVQPYVETVIPLFLKGCEDADEDVRRNAVFGLSSVMVSMARSGMRDVLDALFEPALAAVVAVVNAGFADECAAVDNGAAAIARMFDVYPLDSLPVESLVETMVGAMPLGADLSENATVYGALFALFEASNEHVVGQLPRLLPVFAADLAADGHLPGEVAFNLGLLLGQLLEHDQIGAQIQEMVGNLSGEEQAMLVGVVDEAKRMSG